MAGLDITVSANFARFQSDIGKVVSIAEDASKKIDRAFGLVSTGLKALGAGFTIGLTLDTIKSKITGTIEAAAGLQIIAEKTGATIEGLSQLASVAKLSNTDTDQLATGLQKLSKALVDAKDGGAKTVEAFRAIGISTKELVGLRPDDAFKLIATRLAAYSDGAEKTAVAQQLLGKSGANLLPTMTDLVTVGEQQFKVTAEQAKQADEYEKNLKRLDAAQNAIFKTIAFAVLPVMDVFVKTLLESATRADGLKGAVNDLAKDGSLHDWAIAGAKSVGFVVDAFDGVKRVVQVVGIYIAGTAAAMQALFTQTGGDQFKAIDSIREQVKKDIDQILDAPLFSDRLAKNITEAEKKVASAAPSKRPQIDFRPNTAAGKDDDTKRLFENRLKDLEQFIQRERTLLSERLSVIDRYQALEYLNAREAEDRKQNAINLELAAEQNAYAKQAAIADAEARNAQKDVDRAFYQGKAAEARAKSSLVEQAANAALASSRERLDAIQRRFDLGTQQRLLDNAKANEQNQFELDLIGKSTLAIAQANAVRQVELSLEDRLLQLRKDDPQADISGAIEAAEIEKADAIERVTKLYAAQRTAAAGAQSAFTRYAEEAKNTGAQVDNALTNAFHNAEDALVEFAKTGKLNFRSLVDSIITDLIRMQAKMLVVWATEKLIGFFGGSGLSVDTGGLGINNTGTSLPTAGGAAGGTNFVERDMLTILHKGEAVVPKAYNPDAGSGGGNVTVHNYSGSSVEAQPDQHGNLEIFIEKAARRGQSYVAHDIGTGSGVVSSSMKGRGLNLSGGIARRS